MEECKSIKILKLKHFEMFHLQLAWLDGVIKMTDDERTDLKPQEEGEVRNLKRPELWNAILPFSRVRR